MSVGMVGIKRGMTRVFQEDGSSVPVTVIQLMPMRVSQLKELENDGYRAIQVTAGAKKASRVNKPMAGHFAKAGVEAGNVTFQFRLDDDEMAEIKAGDDVNVDLFEVGQKVDVRGVSKGKGFAGGVKRHHFKMQDATHGNSLSHRAIGSVGQCQTPGRVFKGKKMAGHMGSVNKTVQGQKIMRLDHEKNLLLVRGGVPGCPGGVVFVKNSVKQKRGKK